MLNELSQILMMVGDVCLFVYSSASCVMWTARVKSGRENPTVTCARSDISAAFGFYLLHLWIVQSSGFQFVK